MAFTKEWYKTDDVIQTDAGEIPVWQFLGHNSPDSFRTWINRGVRGGWLRVAETNAKLPHLKRQHPGARRWLVHVARVAALGEKQVG